MRFDSPLRQRHAEVPKARRPDPETALHRPGAATGLRPEAPAVEYVAYGPLDRNEPTCEVVGTYGDLEAEYAAIRKGAGVLDCPHRGTLRVSGADRLGFLDRMLTNRVTDLVPGAVQSAFLLNRKGRIEADLFLVAGPDAVLIDVDVHAVDRTLKLLEGFLFADDVLITDATGTLYRLAVHGPQAAEAAASAAEALAASGAAAAFTVARRDSTGVSGLELFVPRGAVEASWSALLAADDGRRRVRPIGWHAFNIARIEAGTPLYHVDFGPDNLPHETGVLEDRVSFKKGCYPGQEIVARTHNLGRPKQSLVGLRIESGLLPVAGAGVHEKTEGRAVGVVTSSTLSPMLGAIPIAFAMIRSDAAAPGTVLMVDAENERVGATVGPLRFIEGRAP